MTTFAYIVRFGQSEQDFVLTVGLLVAAALLSVFAFKHVRSGTSKRPGLIFVLALIGVAAIVWSAIESASRLFKL